MENWFDSLSRSTTRRGALKAAAVALGAAIALPAVRPESLRATDTEPCFKPCVDAAANKWRTNNDNCQAIAKHRDAGQAFVLLYAYFPLALANLLLPVQEDRECLIESELVWRRATTRCRDEDCGDDGKYPGGTVPKPKPKCDPVEEIICGDICCHTINKCCPDPKTGGGSCWAASHVC
jgi:hypothetical protein